LLKNTKIETQKFSGMKEMGKNKKESKGRSKENRKCHGKKAD